VTFYKPSSLYITIAMIRRRKLITHPSQAPNGARIMVKPKPTLPGIIDLAKTREERTLNYLKRAKKRRI
jgi:hypothetical protein